jgi:SAM-dependent methyltransferase
MRQNAYWYRRGSQEMNWLLPFSIMERSIEYYNRNAEQFLRDTADLDMEALYEPFLALVPNGGHILDAGCGSGRDAKAFLDREYRVTAIDASEAMVAAASVRTGLPVYCMRFNDISFVNEFHGIWASASLLHVPKSEILSVIQKLAGALKQEGAWYMSFKLGEREEVRNGRLFNCYTEATLRQLLVEIPSLCVHAIWTGNDIRADRRDDRWINALVQKRDEVTSLPES